MQFRANQFVIRRHLINTVITDRPHGIVIQNVINAKTGHGTFVSGFKSPTRLAKGIFHSRTKLSVCIAYRNIIKITTDDFGKSQAIMFSFTIATCSALRL